MAGMPAGALIEVAVEPKRQEDRPKFAVALETIARRDPNFRFSIDDSMEQTVLGGISETQLDTIVHELQTEFGVALNIISGTRKWPIERRSRGPSMSTTLTRCSVGAAASLLGCISRSNPARLVVALCSRTQPVMLCPTRSCPVWSEGSNPRDKTVSWPGFR